jgi:hypothetical protein
VSHWVLQSGLEHELGWATMVETLERFGLPYSLHRVVPFVGELLPEPLLTTDDVICIGSYSMRHAAKKYGWNPGVFDLESYGFLEQREHWGAHMLNADSEIWPFGEVRFADGPRFVRPVEDTKVFAGKVFDVQEFGDWQMKVVALGEGDDRSLNAATLVQVSAPKALHHEVRFWIVDGRVVTASSYKVGSSVSYSSQVDSRFVEFASERVDAASSDGWNPVRAFCLDVCDTPNGLRIVEINTINSAGFYAADVQKLVMSLDGLKR